MTFIQKVSEFCAVSSEKGQFFYFLNFLHFSCKMWILHDMEVSSSKTQKNELSGIIQGSLKRGRVQICRFIGYESLMMSTHSAREFFKVGVSSVSPSSISCFHSRRVRHKSAQTVLSSYLHCKLLLSGRPNGEKQHFDQSTIFNCLN